jgi:hypothetical protein
MCVSVHTESAFLHQKSGFLLFVGCVVLVLVCCFVEGFFFFCCSHPIPMLQSLVENSLFYFSEKVSDQEKLEELMLRSQALSAWKGLIDSSHYR